MWILNFEVEKLSLWCAGPSVLREMDDILAFTANFCPLLLDISSAIAVHEYQCDANGTE